jgi:hypothetical protein
MQQNMPDLWLSIPLVSDRHHEEFFMIGALGRFLKSAK